MHGADLDALRDSPAARHRTTVAVRYADLATSGHVNRAAYLAYLEEARLGFRASMADLAGNPDDLSWPTGCGRCCRPDRVRYGRPPATRMLAPAT